MTTEPTVPEAMIEAAARALHGHDRADGEPTWGGLDDWERQSYRDAAAPMLTAALSLCESLTEWRVSYKGYHGERIVWANSGSLHSAKLDLEVALSEGSWPEPTIDSRTVSTWPDGSVLTRPWEPFKDGESR